MGTCVGPDLSDSRLLLQSFASRGCFRCVSQSVEFRKQMPVANDREIHRINAMCEVGAGMRGGRGNQGNLRAAGADFFFRSTGQRTTVFCRMLGKPSDLHTKIMGGSFCSILFSSSSDTKTASVFGVVEKGGVEVHTGNWPFSRFPDGGGSY